MPSFPFARASGDSLRVDFFFGVVEAEAAERLEKALTSAARDHRRLWWWRGRRPLGIHRAATRGPPRAFANGAGSLADGTYPRWRGAGPKPGQGIFLGSCPVFFCFFWRPCAFFHGVTGGRRRGGAAPACSPYEIAPATRVRRDMGNPIYAVPKSKSEFTHVYIQVRPPRPQPPLGIFPHAGPRSSSSTIAGRRTGRQSRLWTENLTRHETTTATILCARRQNILPDCFSSFSFFLSLATPAA